MARPPPKPPTIIGPGRPPRDPSPAPRTEWVNFRPVRHLPDEGVNRPMLIAIGVALAFLVLGLVWLGGLPA